ncbi:hypothetical protein GCM10010171_03810 [Actinokineospora fastidiosa]|uniref:Uncharacterized protein n=1 Tax=Actinokineospora fastidiosa TaxID=1816 RepID=A0A918G2F1_9PSEU|nr:hypothetical protein GCM10010171_03810 [Actinokineospora fastidiosa]
MTYQPGPPPNGWQRMESARSVILVALIADGLQIATALTTALLDPTKWREFFTFSSVAAALVVAVIVVATWRAIPAAGRALGIVFVLANVAFVVFYARPGTAQGLPPPPTSEQTTVSPPTQAPATTTTTTQPPPPPTTVPPTTTPRAPAPKTAAPRPAASWTVTPDTSRESSVDPGSGLQLRFWPYPSGSEVVGDLRYEDGYAWAPVVSAAGARCRTRPTSSPASPLASTWCPSASPISTG